MRLCPCPVALARSPFSQFCSQNSITHKLYATAMAEDGSYGYYQLCEAFNHTLYAGSEKPRRGACCL